MVITLYTKAHCGWCEDLKEFLHERSISFTEKEVRNNPIYLNELVEVSGQDRAPTIIIDGEILPDTDIDEVETFLQAKHT